MNECIVRRPWSFLLACAALPFVSHAAGETAAYWTVTANTWGMFGEASNWNIGSPGSEDHAVPGTGNFIYQEASTSDKKCFDLGGGSYEVNGLSALNTSSTKSGNGQGTLSVTS